MIQLNSNDRNLTTGTTGIPKVYVIHENEDWLIPLRVAFEKHGVPYEEWFIHEGRLDLSATPPEGIFYNRMSASSHTRGHRYAVELTEPLIAWLDAHGRKVVNDRRAIQLEVRKFEQYLALRQFGIPTPRTIAANNKRDLLQAADSFDGQPFIFKPNRGGKGTGVQLFQSKEALQKALEDYETTSSLDGINLLQEYVKPADGHIVRCEFIGGRFYYAVKVDASGGFELCPADSCQTGDAFCPTEPAIGQVAKARFEVLENYHNPCIEQYEMFLKANGMEIAAIEYAENEAGERLVYDVNINTNYNQEAESRSVLNYGGMEGIARYLQSLLHKIEAGAVSGVMSCHDSQSWHD